MSASSQSDLIQISPAKLRELLNEDWRRFLEFSGQRIRKRRWIDGFSARFAAVVLIRISQRLHAKGWMRVAKLFSLFNFLIFGIEVPARLDIGPGLVIPHTHGTVIGAGYIGRNVTIYQQVTLGAKFADFGYDNAKRPHICDGVVITAGAKVLGPVRIGARSVIGANAVVLSDIPPDCIAVGVPARIINRSSAIDDSMI